MHGLTKIELRKFTFQYAIKFELNVPPSWITNESAGKDWELGFMKKHSQLKIKRMKNKKKMINVNKKAKKVFRFQTFPH